MKNFNWEQFKNKTNKIAVHCKTREEAEDFCREMHKHNMKWRDGESYLDEINWSRYVISTCYDNGGYSAIDFYKNNNYTILEWSDYMKKNKFTLNDIKDGMVIELRNSRRYVKINSRLINKNGWNNFYDYSVDTLSIDEHDISFDIMAVYEVDIKNVSCLDDILNKENLIPIWERKEPKKMTLKEVCDELGYDVEIIKGE